MPDETLSSTTARADDAGVAVRVKLSSADLCALIRYGRLALAERPQLGPVGSVHVSLCEVELI